MCNIIVTDLTAYIDEIDGYKKGPTQISFGPMLVMKKLQFIKRKVKILLQKKLSHSCFYVKIGKTPCINDNDDHHNFVVICMCPTLNKYFCHLGM